VVKVMYFDPVPQDAPELAPDALTRTVLGLNSVALLLLGILPGALLGLCFQALQGVL
jgi:NADH-quinone oxidoreductase subunit N